MNAQKMTNNPYNYEIIYFCVLKAFLIFLFFIYIFSDMRKNTLGKEAMIGV